MTNTSNIDFQEIFRHHNIIMITIATDTLEIIDINNAGKKYYTTGEYKSPYFLNELYDIDKYKLSGLIHDALENEPNLFKISQQDDSGKRYVDVHIKNTNLKNIAFLMEEDVTDRVINKKNVHARDEILHIIASSAKSAIASVDIESATKKILENIGLALEVSRAFIFEFKGSKEELTLYRKIDWRNESAGNKEFVEKIPFFPLNPLTRRIYKLIESGNIYISTRSQVRKEKNEEFFPQNVESMLLVPIHVGNRPWGIIGVDDCFEEREWELDDIESLNAVSGIFASMIMKEKQTKDLAKTKMSFDLAVSAGKIGLWQWNGEEDTVLLDENMREQFGVEDFPENLSEGSWTKLIYKEDLEKINKYFQKRIEEKHRDFSFEHRYRNDKNEILWFYSRGRIFYTEGLPTKIISSCTNITELKNAQEKIEQLNHSLEEKVKDRTARLEYVLKELQGEIDIRKTISEELMAAKDELSDLLIKEKDLNELKSRFISMVSHEYRTPLTVILSSVSIMEMYGEKLTEKEIGHHLTKIKNSIQKMTTLLEDIILISKEEAGKIEVVKKEVNVVEICRKVLDDISYIDNKQHSFDFIHHASEYIWETDEKLLSHVLSNLLSNAMKYSPVNSTVKFEFMPGINDVTFRITDSGIGIPKEEHDKMFEPFFRCKNAENIPGTGLGLSISKKFSRLLGGDITFNSVYKKGSTFIVKLKSN